MKAGRASSYHRQQDDAKERGNKRLVVGRSQRTTAQTSSASSCCSSSASSSITSSPLNNNHNNTMTARSSATSSRVLVDVSMCKYPILVVVARELMGFETTRLDLNAPTALLQQSPRAAGASPRSTGTGSVANTTKLMAPTIVTSAAATPSLFWSDLSVSVMRLCGMKQNHIVGNHFPGMDVIARKKQMATVLNRMAARYPTLYDFFPASYTTYEDFYAATRQKAKEKAQQQQQQRYYIVKPSNGCMGKNIYITTSVHRDSFIARSSGSPGGSASERRSNNNSNSINTTQLLEMVVQDYVDRPLLFNGRKFDLRCYVLVIDMNPPTIYFHSEGLVRVCALPYEAPSSSNEGAAAVHLANYAVNKKVAGGFVASPTRGGGGGGFGDDENDGADDEDRNGATSSSSSIAIKQSFAALERVLVQIHHDAQDDSALSSLRERFPSSFQFVAHVWSQIHDIVVKTILAAQPNIVKTVAPLMRRTNGPSSGGISSGRNSRRAPSATATTRGDSTTGLNSTVGIASTSSSSLGGSLSSSSTNSTSQSQQQQQCQLAPVAGASVDCCFEVLGFDIMFDAQLKPWLIEVNHSPSWNVDTDLDFSVKTAVLRDTLQLVRPLLRNSGRKGRNGSNLKRKGGKHHQPKKERNDDDGNDGSEKEDEDADAEGDTQRDSGTTRQSPTTTITTTGNHRSDLLERVDSRASGFERIFPTAQRCQELADVIEENADYMKIIVEGR